MSDIVYQVMRKFGEMFFSFFQEIQPFLTVMGDPEALVPDQGTMTA